MFMLMLALGLGLGCSGREFDHLSPGVQQCLALATILSATPALSTTLSMGCRDNSGFLEPSQPLPWVCTSTRKPPERNPRETP